MSWGPTRYLQFNNVAQARALLGNVLGERMRTGNELTGGEHRHFMVAPVEEWITRPTFSGKTMTDPGEQRAGYWVMIKMRTDWTGHGNALSGLTAAGVIQTLAAPSNIFAGDA